MEINIENMRIGTEENFYSYEEFNNLLGDTIEFLKGKGFKSDSKIPIWCHDNLNIIALMSNNDVKEVIKIVKESIMEELHKED